MDWPGERAILDQDQRSLRPVINATGVLLHTGLGRAPLAEEAIAAVAEVSRGYCNLELDLDEGERGRRTAGIARLVCALVGAEAATAVNNNAAATLLALQALAAGREVIVSRGQLVEIGGSFRLPEIFELSVRGSAKSVRPTRHGWPITSERSTSKPRPSCASIGVTSKSSALPRSPHSPSWRRWPAGAGCG